MTHKQSLNGIILLDKPLGMSSNRALQKVKGIFAAKKAGHTGSLDPLATGLLPICFGEATKFSQYLLDADKSYRVTAKLGQVTSTGDSEGEIISEGVIPALSRDDLEAILEQFRGDILQVPPMHSALKRDGKPLYKLARKGIEVERPARPVTVFKLSCIQHTDEYMTFDVDCSKGTYIRSLIQDIGNVIGCGAHVHDLRRTAVAGCPADKMHSMDSLRELPREALHDIIMPTDALLVHYPKITVNDDQLLNLCHGLPAEIEQSPETELFRICHAEFAFIGLGGVNSDGRLIAKRLLDTLHIRQALA